jgi:uncharacterized cupredoxin-like copper-binding protein
MRSRWIQGGRRCLFGSAVLACAIALGSCGGSSDSSGGAPVIQVTERDFRIDVSPAHVAAGDVTLQVRNAGPDRHELLVIPYAGGRLPLSPDGLTLDETLFKNSEPGSLEPAQPGSTRRLSVRLAPGHYLLFCNMEGHFMAGMSAQLVVGP